MYVNASCLEKTNIDNTCKTEMIKRKTHTTNINNEQETVFFKLWVWGFWAKPCPKVQADLELVTLWPAASQMVRYKYAPPSSYSFIVFIVGVVRGQSLAMYT